MIKCNEIFVSGPDSSKLLAASSLELIGGPPSGRYLPLCLPFRLVILLGPSSCNVRGSIARHCRTGSAIA